MEPATDPISGIRLIGRPLDYADGSEQTMLAVLEAAGDRRVASDELARQISDWPSRYHLSRLRANLLRPLRLDAGVRVLDAGAGTGALARYAGEVGASVVALEGSLSRARAAAARCADLDRVEVVCGSLEAFDDPAGFDVVLCVGVLEYATRPDEFIARLRSHARPGGVVVVAIENQLGLKYLLGYGEDHLGQPWAGVEGYSGPGPPQTWSRRRLDDMLAAAGLGAHRWHYPFPDYKLPSVVVADSAYDEPDLVDQLVRWPSSHLASQPQRVCDDRLAHRVFLDAGLGRQVANSFLVVAGSEVADVDRHVDPAVNAWFFGADRQRHWLAGKVFSGGDVRREALAPLDRVTEQGWLRQIRPVVQPLVRGRTIEQMALDACRQGSQAVGEVLREWREHLRGLEVKAKADGHPVHPFRGDTAVHLLPEDHLDVNLSNFVVDASGSLRYVDGEWRAAGEVDSDLVCARALWWFAADLVTRGVAHPWPHSISVDELAGSLSLTCDVRTDPEVIELVRAAEAELQAKVRGLDIEDCRNELLVLGRARQDSPGVIRHLPFTTLRRDLARSYEHLADVCRDLETALQQVDTLKRAVEAEQGLRNALAQQREAESAQASALRAELERATAELAAEAGARRSIENHPLLRGWRRARRTVRLAR